VRVHQAKPPQTPAPAPVFWNLGNIDGPGISHQNRFDPAVAADEQPQLPAGFKGEMREVPGEIWRNDFVGADFPSAQGLDAATGFCF